MKSRTLSEFHDNFWPAWADVLLTVLLIVILYIFIQYVTYSGLNELVKVKPAQEKLETLIKEEFEKDYQTEIKIKRDGNFHIITFSDKILFDLAKSDLKEQGREVLSRLGKILRDNQLYQRIQVEGHTDDLSLNPRSAFKSNWELSSARATSVVRFLQDNANISPGLLSANGYSEYQPTVPNTDEKNRSLNRRIEIVLVYTTIEDRRRTGGNTPPAERDR
jgi:chemotaxis protein MotB